MQNKNNPFNFFIMPSFSSTRAAFHAGHTSATFWANNVDCTVSSKCAAQDAEWCADQLSSTDATRDGLAPFMWNATSIGNIAYMALNAPTADLQTTSQALFDAITTLFFIMSQDELDAAQKAESAKRLARLSVF
jgi:hypothetical protein